MEALIESIDSELTFYRKRAGQVFFLSLLVEGLILSQQVTVLTPNSWIHPSGVWTSCAAILHTLLFLAVAVVGSVLGAEYRRRIHIWKRHRNEQLTKKIGIDDFPEDRKSRISEIRVLYLVLGFLSGAGIVLSWLKVG